MPQGIQRRRVKGWRKPPNSVIVDRTSRWGNPFKASMFGKELSIALYRQCIEGSWNPSLVDDLSDGWRADAYRLHCAFIKRWMDNYGWTPSVAARVELKDKDLCCTCPLGEPCHRDVLIEVANS